MTSQIRVLVTGAGSGVGQGIIKCLKISSLPLHLTVADISPLNPAFYRVDDACLIPRVEEPGALAKILSVLADKKIDVLLIGSEFELGFFSRHAAEIESKTGTKVMVSPLKAVQLSNDKYETYKFLAANQLPFPLTHLPADLEDAAVKAGEIGYPCMIKPRCGTSSRAVAIVQNEEELRRVYPKVTSPVVQQLIMRPSKQLAAEYTCGLFKTTEGSLVGPFTARRALKGGDSWIVEVDDFAFLKPVLTRIGEALDFKGPLNVQLMYDGKNAVAFEFNCRFSGTAPIRAHFGFNEPEMMIRNYFLKQKIGNIKIKKGMAFRYMEEVMVEGVTVNNLTAPYPQGIVPSWF
ncbi:MAG: hypothetical protein A2Z83_05780 [Omnitrophica bacterium GWA2_52_8]|nr:MAG: hypothetical protein A2Z83_05780 [Omnitrophica bacterium GWA2_52_8]